MVLSYSSHTTYLWLCSLCNTKATSKQALLLHADGKKHRARARAFLASQQQPAQTDKSAPDAKVSMDTAPNGEAKDDKNAEQPKLQESSKQDNLKPENEVPAEKKKRKLEVSEGDLIKKSRNDTSVDMGNGEVIQSNKATGESNLKKEIASPHCTSAVNNKIKWKKFIKAALKSVRVLNFGMTSFLVFCLIYLCYTDLYLYIMSMGWSYRVNDFQDGLN